MIEAMRNIRPLLGSLVAVPIVVLFFGSQWSWDDRFELVLRSSDDDSENTASAVIPARSSARADLPRPVDLLTLEIRADGAVGYRVSAARADAYPEVIWTALEQANAPGTTTRRSPPLRLREPTASLHFSAREPRDPVPMPSIGVIAPRWSFPHLALIPALWLLFIMLGLKGRGGRDRPSAQRALATWGRCDVWLATGLIYLVLFRIAAPGWVGLAAATAIFVAVWFARLMPAVTAVLLATTAAVATLAPHVLTAVVVAQVSEQFDLTVDHRPRPNGKNINSDGLRFEGESDSVWEEDFVVLFLGDSFTFGTRLRDPDTYPKAFENFANAHSCTQRIQAINFGWPSASPLLGLRLLRRIGYAYKPDLIVYSLDMTDFLDDLRYERALRSAGEYEVDTSRVVQQLVDRFAPWLNADFAAGDGLRELRRPGRPRAVGGEPELPTDRFFVTNAPLDQTRHWIETGVMKNLDELERFSSGTLHAPTTVVIYPRSYQYPNSESPDNWERRFYDADSPFVREPFRYFSEVAAELPYPVIDLMPTFEQSTATPLFLEDDPHWNRAGARLAGTALVTRLVELGLLPCKPE
ncbi:MAG: hypothetical protein JRE13_15730 [Deltaproteobacteria bacterium]|nr:hypothetical protein [Deltaproteobacteria bacterium]